MVPLSHKNVLKNKTVRNNGRFESLKRWKWVYVSSKEEQRTFIEMSLKNGSSGQEAVRYLPRIEM